MVMVALFLVSMGTSAYSQWPLGKELAQTPQKAEPGPGVTTTGRFQVFVSPNHKGYTFMLDTETGKVWTIIKDHTSGDLSLRRVPVEDVDGKLPPTSGSGAAKDGEKKGSETK
jgi:hypothetical protein